MMEKKFPFPGEVLSENHQFRTSKPPYPRILDSRRENEEAPKVLLKTQSLRIENSEPSALSSINFKFSRGEEREDRSVQDAPEATSLVRVVCSVVW